MEITMQQCWDMLKTQNNNDVNKAVETMLDVVTSGIWVSWDNEKINLWKTELINKYNKESK